MADNCNPIDPRVLEPGYRAPSAGTRYSESEWLNVDFQPLSDSSALIYCPEHPSLHCAPTVSPGTDALRAANHQAHHAVPVLAEPAFPPFSPFQDWHHEAEEPWNHLPTTHNSLVVIRTPASETFLGPHPHRTAVSLTPQYDKSKPWDLDFFADSDANCERGNGGVGTFNEAIESIGSWYDLDDVPRPTDLATPILPRDTRSADLYQEQKCETPSLGHLWPGCNFVASSYPLQPHSQYLVPSEEQDEYLPTRPIRYTNTGQDEYLYEGSCESQIPSSHQQSHSLVEDNLAPSRLPSDWSMIDPQSSPSPSRGYHSAALPAAGTHIGQSRSYVRSISTSPPQIFQDTQQQKPLSIDIATAHSEQEQTSKELTEVLLFPGHQVRSHEFLSKLQHKTRGGRTGPLAKEKAIEVGKTRKARTVCLRCRQTKVSCTGGIPCDRCHTLNKVTIWDQPCIKAYFLEIVRGGTCNYVSQRSINHLTLSGNNRITKVLPETFNLPELLSLLEHRKARIEIRVSQPSGPLYVLDLERCYEFLSKVRRKQGPKGDGHLGDFIDDTLLGHLDNSGWHRCVRDHDPRSNLLATLLRWNAQPIRASFAVASVGGSGTETPMDIEDPDQEIEIILAAQLPRIFCRALEVEAYTSLQKALNHEKSLAPEEAKDFVAELGRLIVMLRWQISWRRIMLAGGDSNDNISTQLVQSNVVIPVRFVSRMDELIRVLYFYFCNARRKIPSFTSMASMEGFWTSYGDTLPAFHRLPGPATIEAFEAWMEEGKTLIRQATGKR